MTTSKSDVSDLAGPFLTLKPGQFLEFELFPDIPSNTVKCRGGILLDVQIQVAPLKSGEVTVQTLLSLVSRKDWDLGKREPTEVVPLEALKKVQVEPAPDEFVSVWKDVIPALGGRETPLEPVDIKALEESRKLSGLRAPKQPRGSKKATKVVKGEGPGLYISKKRR